MEGLLNDALQELYVRPCARREIALLILFFALGADLAALAFILIKYALTGH